MKSRTKNLLRTRVENLVGLSEESEVADLIIELIKQELLEEMPEEKRYSKLERCGVCSRYQFQCSCDEAYNSALKDVKRMIERKLW